MVRRIAIYADGADLGGMRALADRVQGYTTNPSLMRKAGVRDYRLFAAAVLNVAGGKPVSFEVLADDFAQMDRQAREIASWGENVYVKVPITNTRGKASAPLIAALAAAGVKINVTAVFTAAQALTAIEALGEAGGIVSIFAGRIADTGVSPVQTCLTARSNSPRSVKLLWASAREPFNVVQAEEACCDIITLSPALIEKLSMFGKDLEAYSLETVRQFQTDAEGITL